jgi:hypothetical protein
MFEPLEPPALLATLAGTVRFDAMGLGRANVTDPGVPAVIVYLDLDNNGVRSLGEPMVITADDDPSTPHNEAGTYAFEVEPGRYTVRSDFGDAPTLLQTAPLRQSRPDHPFLSQHAQWVNSFHPIEYVFEFSGTLHATAEPAEAPWSSLTSGDGWSLSLAFPFNPALQGTFDTDNNATRFAIPVSYMFRAGSRDSDAAGFGEMADVAAEHVEWVTRIAPDGRRLVISIPLQSGSDWHWLLDVPLIPANDLSTIPAGGEVAITGESRPATARLMHATENGLQELLFGTVDAHQWDARHAERFGPRVDVVALEQDLGPIDFWVTGDEDQDGLPTSWETPGGGLDLNGDGVIDLDLAARGADPMHKDIFVEVDAMLGRAPLPWSLMEFDFGAAGVTATGTVLDRVIQAFAESPVANPDGSTGIRLQIELDEQDLPLVEFLDPAKPWHEFDQIKADHVGGSDRRSNDSNAPHTVAARNYVYRYGLFADTRANQSSGLAELPGNDFFVTLGHWRRYDDHQMAVPGGTVDQQAGTFMHELGHTLGLRHGGADNLNHKPNYLSVMNYHWQMPNANVGWQLDYSHGALPPLVPNRLDEQVGIAAPENDGREVFVGPDPLRRVPVHGPLDWNRNGNSNDTNVALSFYRSLFHDADGVARAYDILTHPDSAATHHFALHGHDDWHFTAADFSFRDDPEFADGVHACDNPEQTAVSCAEDTTDFFTLSVSPDSFEPDEQSRPVRIPLLDFSDLFEFDIESGISLGTFSLHNAPDVDWFIIEVPAEGQFHVRVVYDANQSLRPEIQLTNQANQVVGTPQRRLGQHIVQINDLNETGATEIKIRIQNSSVPSDPDALDGLQVDPVLGFRYRLEVYAPRIREFKGTRWVGADASSGVPGDGQFWNDIANWTVDDIPDRMPDEQSVHTFSTSGELYTVSLVGNRSVRSLQVRGDVTFCPFPCSDQLTISEGWIDVLPGVRAEIQATLDSGTQQLAKTGQGSLAIYGPTPSLVIHDGQLAGQPTIVGDLLVRPNGKANWDNPIAGSEYATGHVTGTARLQGTWTIDVGSTAHDQLNANRLRLTASSVVLLNALEPIGVPGTQTTRRIVQGEREVVTAQERATFGLVRGADRALDTIFAHAGHGVFLEDVLYDSLGAEIALRQSGPGDASGDGRFQSTDLIQVLAAGKFETSRPASWLEGDWDGDGVFGTSDLILAMQQGTYEI